MSEHRKSVAGWRVVAAALRCARPLALGVACVSGAAISVPAAAQDDSLSRVNQDFRVVNQDRRSDLVLLPLLAKMGPPPRSLSSVHQARLLPASASGFGEASNWAKDAPQVAVLNALARVTKETDWRTAFAFAQPYGTEGVTPEVIASELYTELGDPPTLALARMGYMPALDRLEILVNIEATRLAADGQTNDALDLLANFAYFARQICDRQFAREVEWGLHALARTFERIRDVAYMDYKGPRKLNAERVKKIIDRLADAGGYLDLSRMKFPLGDEIAASQLVNRLYDASGAPRTSMVAGTLAQVGARDHPLRLFTEAAKWRESVGTLANASDARNAVQQCVGDWQRRWNAEYHDERVQGRVTSYQELDKKRFAVVVSALPDMGRLRELRQQARVEGVGTRAALAVLAHTMTTGSYPPQLSSVRPRWWKELEPDPYTPPERSTKAQAPPRYMVPMRDTPKDASGRPQPHTVDVVVEAGDLGTSSFTVNLKDDVFILYSAGTDKIEDYAKRVQNTTSVVQNADYLFWPPVLSLHRQHLADRGDL